MLTKPKFIYLISATIYTWWHGAQLFTNYKSSRNQGHQQPVFQKQSISQGHIILITKSACFQLNPQLVTEMSYNYQFLVSQTNTHDINQVGQSKKIYEFMFLLSVIYKLRL